MKALHLCLALMFVPSLALAQTATETLSVDGATLTLNQVFSSLPAWREGGTETNASAKPLDDPSFSWLAGYIWDHPPLGSRTPWPQPTHDFPAWTSNGAAEASPNGDMINQIDPQSRPLQFNGALDFVARPMPEKLAETIATSDPKKYLSGTISSFPYSQKYGVFVMSAKFPDGQPGIWPAFWLLPVDKSWPPEIDVVETLGKEAHIINTTVHTNYPNKNSSTGHATDTHVDLSADFHEYAVDWSPQMIKWYFDRKLIFSTPTPADLDKPCYIIANLAVGNPDSWGGAPNSRTIFPAVMQVQYVKVWQRPEYAQ